MRTTLNLNSGWVFAKGMVIAPEQKVPDDSIPVELPHCYNLDDTAYRGICTYYRELSIPEDQKGQCLFLEFQGVNSVCTVYLNGSLLGKHKGGYSTFRFDITQVYKWEHKNIITVLVDNSHYEDVNPLNGDFSILGGIYRDVCLICTSRTHFDLMHYGSSGVLLTPLIDDKGNATLNISVKIVQADDYKLEILLANPEGKECLRKTVDPNISELSFPIPEPELWNGVNSPKLYSCILSVKGNDMVYDRVEIAIGLRRFTMDPEKGFFLNGMHYQIHGVSKHQDRAGKGNATSRKDLDEDMALIKELGANAVRLSHYQHPQYFHDLCDKEGMIVWAEIPMLCLTDHGDLIENAKQQLTELILQNYHHPSICFWGLQNEIAVYGEEEFMFKGVEELHQLAKKLDPNRLTASANLFTVKNNSPLNFISDIVGYNVYYGWYYGEMEDYTKFLDQFHLDNPDVPLGISEYGVDCNVELHSDCPKRKDYSEEFQGVFHETVYPIINSRKFVWGSFVWNMFDFSSTIRSEGKIVGLNTKGLVTYDRKIRKDAFYFYKACWSKEPFLHIASQRFTNRHTNTINIKVYSNMEEVTLSTNDFHSTIRGQYVFLFENVPLKPGQNQIVVYSGNIKEEVFFCKVESPDEAYIYFDPNPGFNVKNWFESGENEVDLFPDEYYSLNDSIHELKKSPEAWTLIKETIPLFDDESRISKGLSLPLLRIINRISGQFEEKVIKDLNRKLNKINKIKHDGSK